MMQDLFDFDVMYPLHTALSLTKMKCCMLKDKEKQ